MNYDFDDKLKMFGYIPGPGGVFSFKGIFDRDIPHNVEPPGLMFFYVDNERLLAVMNKDRIDTSQIAGDSISISITGVNSVSVAVNQSGNWQCKECGCWQYGSPPQKHHDNCLVSGSEDKGVT